eukprot:gnl/TRDRNA2_/TRDRNA2_132432_c0_seq2.p1 gnl/TRDRNA2_/TRDRNA2_132432_c0~~gnl/TRDRNA2_/TRDRNA2_132432_c0_seq2.p1  ORF type:complete len:263 (+),score=26.24 gnl/TRDRNA2_/TRDRNA2_132432_c0_seq2:62-850(+)
MASTASWSVSFSNELLRLPLLLLVLQLSTGSATADIEEISACLDAAHASCTSAPQGSALLQTRTARSQSPLKTWHTPAKTAAQGKGKTAAPSTTACKDTPGFTNGSGHGCASYAKHKWCANGGASRGKAWTLGKRYRFPEQNCCICGKAKTAPTAATATADKSLTCGPLTHKLNAKCKDHVDWVYTTGKHFTEAGEWYRNMQAAGGVSVEDAKREDFQRVFFCWDQAYKKCGLPPCSGCSRPPCDAPCPGYLQHPLPVETSK